MEKIKAKDVVIYAEYDKALALREYMLECGMNVTHAICNHKLSKIEKASTHIVYMNTEKDKINLFKNLKNTMILGDDIFANLADNSNIKVNICGSFLNFRRDENTILGFSGIKFLLHSK